MFGLAYVALRTRMASCAEACVRMCLPGLRKRTSGPRQRRGMHVSLSTQTSASTTADKGKRSLDPSSAMESARARELDIIAACESKLVGVVRPVEFIHPDGPAVVKLIG